MSLQETLAKIAIAIAKSGLRLQGKLAALKFEFDNNLAPPAVVEVLHRATDELIAPGAQSRALKAGDVAPMGLRIGAAVIAFFVSFGVSTAWAQAPGSEFKDCDKCLEMVVVPAGSFTMGSPASENGRSDNAKERAAMGLPGSPASENGRSDNEGPQHTVKIAAPFAVGKFHVTVDQFAAFVADTGYDSGSKCWTFEDGKGEEREGRSWRNPGFSQQGSHPAVCLNWNDATAYAAWLSRKTGKAYRLLTEAEWEYAARARTGTGSYPRYWFGDEEADLCRYGNVADQTTKSAMPGADTLTFALCEDGYAYTSPVGSFPANSFGLYDMAGNAWQWTQDCYHDTYDDAPADGSAWTTGDCSRRIRRGGSWIYGPKSLRAANRAGDAAGFRSGSLGFRLGRTL